MNLDYLRAIVAAARHRSITKAAHELRTSQPSLSRQLRKLEETYNVKLLVRSGIGVELTQEGRDFLTHAEAILEHIQMIEKRFSKPERLRHPPPLRVGGGYAISASTLPMLLGAFKKQHPQVEVILRSNSTNTLEQMIMKGTLDLILTTLAPNKSDLVSEPYMRMKVVSVVGKGFLPNQKALTLKDIAKIPLIVLSSPDGRGMTETFFQKLRDQGFRPKILMRCDSPEAIKTAVKKKLGIGILYEDIVKDDLARGDFRRIRIADFPSEAQSYVVYEKHRPLSASAERFLEILRKHCRLAREMNSPGWRA